MNELNSLAGGFNIRNSSGMLVMIWLLFLPVHSQKSGDQALHSTDDYVVRNEDAKNPFIIANPILQKGAKRNKPKVVDHVRDLGNGFRDYGVAVPYATSRGTVATVDKQGHHIILIWLYDHRGTYSLLKIDTDQKKSKQFFLPFVGNSFASLLSSRNRFYTQLNGRFVEFDPNRNAFTFIGKTSPGTAMSMTEDDEGVIWAALKPNCNLVSYNPETGKLTDYGVIHSSKARQEPRSIAADNKGWIYVTAGSPAKEQVVAFSTKSHKIRTIQQKTKKNLSLFSAQNGRVIGTVKGHPAIELYRGKSSAVQGKKKVRSQSYVTGNQSLFHRTFSDGKRIDDWVSATSVGFLKNRKVTIRDPKTDKSRKISFDYKTEGSNIMGIAAGPDHTIVGGTNFPMIFFRYNPSKNTWSRHGAFGQFNTLTVQGGKLFMGLYPHGNLLEWNPKKKWIPTQKGKKGTNPRYLAKAYPYINRPHDLLIYPDSRTVVMAGRPSAKRDAGGLLFWDRKTKTVDNLKNIDALPKQSTQSLVALPDNKILGGTTNKSGESGGVRLAKQAELYIMNLKSHKVEWSGAVIPGVKSYQDLCVTSGGLVLGVAGLNQFFVFDPVKHKILRLVNLKKSFGSGIPYTQGQRVFVKNGNRNIYLLLQKSILKLNPDSLKLSLLAKTPTNIDGGGAYLNGRIYYISGLRTRLNSYTPQNGS